MPEIKWSGSPTHSLGVEFEVALASPETRDLVPAAAAVIAAAAPHVPAPVRLEREFLANTVELVSGVCDTTAQACDQIKQGLQAVCAAADTQGLMVVAAGSHPFARWEDQPVSEKENYQEIIERTRWWGRQMLIWGIYTHIGIPERDAVWPVIGALLTYQPLLLALTASSPGYRGADTGYASNRTMLYQQLPTAGLPPEVFTWEQWEAYCADQLASGVTTELGNLHLDIRPAAKYGTIEIRVADATNDWATFCSVVALSHCLTVWLYRRWQAGEQLERLQAWHVTENKWRAARYGREAILITDRATTEYHVREWLQLLLPELLPVAKDLGCLNEIKQLPQLLAGPGLSQQLSELYAADGNWLRAVDATKIQL